MPKMLAPSFTLGPQTNVSSAETFTQTVDPTTIPPGTKYFVDFNVTYNYAGFNPPPDVSGPDTSRGPIAATDMFGPRAIFEIEGVAQYNYPTGPYGHAPYGFSDHLLVKNDPAWTGSVPTTRSITPAWTFMNSRAYVADSSSITFRRHDLGLTTGTGACGFVDSPLIFTAATGEITATESMPDPALGVHDDDEYTLTSFYSYPLVCGRTSLARRVAFDVGDTQVSSSTFGPIMDEYYGSKLSGAADQTGPGGIGSAALVWQQIGLRVPRLIMAVDNIGIQCDSRLSLWRDNFTETSATPETILSIGAGATHTYTGTDHLFRTVLNYNPTIVIDASMSSFSPGTLFGAGFTLKSAANSTARNFRSLRLFRDSVTVQADTSADTMTNHIPFMAQGTFSIANGGTLALTNLYGFLASAPAVGSGVTVTTRYGLRVEDFTGSGTVTTQIGVDIAALTGAGTDIGIRNAAPTAYPPSSQAISTNGATIAPTATVHEITLDTSRTLSSTPHIADGQDGQLLILINADTADTLTLRDQSAIASNLRLPGSANLALAPRDAATFIFNSTLGDWICVGYSI